MCTDTYRGAVGLLCFGTASSDRISKTSNYECIKCNDACMQLATPSSQFVVPADRKLMVVVMYSSGQTTSSSYGAELLGSVLGTGTSLVPFWCRACPTFSAGCGGIPLGSGRGSRRVLDVVMVTGTTTTTAAPHVVAVVGLVAKRECGKFDSTS